MKKLADLICAAKVDLLANMQARAARLEKAFANANQGLHPKQDCNGRHHAPCDGYVLASDDWLDYPQGTQEFYGKGEFLPIPVDMEKSDCARKVHWSNNHKAKCPLSFVEVIEKNTKGWADIDYGKIWEIDGVQWCYVYITANSNFGVKLVDAIKDSIESVSVKVATVKGDAPIGKATIKGYVSGIKFYEGAYGIEHKMMVVLENGATVYGSVPASICSVERGQNVEFSATFEVSNNDKGHAFFKRPTKAKIL